MTFQIEAGNNVPQRTQLIDSNYLITSLHLDSQPAHVELPVRWCGWQHFGVICGLLHAARPAPTVGLDLGPPNVWLAHRRQMLTEQPLPSPSERRLRIMRG